MTLTNGRRFVANHPATLPVPATLPETPGTNPAWSEYRDGHYLAMRRSDGSPWVRRARAGMLPASDRTGSIRY